MSNTDDETSTELQLELGRLWPHDGNTEYEIKNINMLSQIEKIKIKLIAEGVKISKRAKQEITKNGEPLSLFEYPTTSGVTLILPNDIYVNSHFSEKFLKPQLELDCLDGNYFLLEKKHQIPVKVVLVPNYYNKKLKDGTLVRDIIVSHADRMRINPIIGCSFRCKFCDTHNNKYQKNNIKNIIEAISIALKDKNIKPKHLLISGGTPMLKDFEYLDMIYKRVTEYLKKKNIPVDIMLAPRKDMKILKKLKGWEVNGLSINLEVYNKKLAKKIIPQKAAISREYYFEFIREAVKIFGKGKIRSLLLVGIEKESDTLKGIEELAKLGCDVALSPLIPGSKTLLNNAKSPSAKNLEKIFIKSQKITDKYGVVIGPRCIPCQHNTLAFPDNSGNYFFS